MGYVKSNYGILSSWYVLFLSNHIKGEISTRKLAESIVKSLTSSPLKKTQQFVLEAKVAELNCYPFSGFTMLMINGPKNKIRTSKNATFWWEGEQLKTTWEFFY